MFENPGGRIKSIAEIVFIIEVIAVVVLGIVTWTNIGYFEGFLIGVIVIAGGIGASYLSVLGLYAFGELVENSSITAYELSRAQRKERIIVSPQNNSSVVKSGQKNVNNKNGFWVCPNCFTENQMICGTCGCGTKRPS